ncbi:hypothetical protein J2W24_002944 [Variovorax boronicumulans]|nr:hypothetical protein [Variovorax boronicumulans]
MARCIPLNLDCASLCTAAAEMMARNSENAGLACSLWAAECASHEEAHCPRCADACRQCETECQRIATA